MTKARDLGPVDYSGLTAPPIKYRCDECDAYGCKLWREYQTFLNHQVLRCAVCASSHTDRNIDSLDTEGRILSSPREDRYKTDQIGNLIPAVPTKEGDTYWGYSSVPDDGVMWWRKLPSRPAT